MKKIILFLIFLLTMNGYAEEVYLYDYNGSPEVCQSPNPQDVMDCFYRDFGKDGYEFRQIEDGDYQLYSFSRGEWRPDDMIFYVSRRKISCDAGKKESIGQINFTKIGDDIMPKNICYSNCEQEVYYNSDVPVLCIGKECSMFNVDLTSTGKVCVPNPDGSHKIAENVPQDIPDENRLKPCPNHIGSYRESVAECEAFPPKKDPEQPVPPKESENPEQPPQTPPETPPETTDEGDKDNPAGGGKRPDNGNNVGTPNNDGNPDGKGSGTHSGQGGQQGDANQNGGDTGNDKGAEEGGEEGEDEGNSIGGGNCKTREPPKCKGDAALCYIGQEQWRHRCLVEQAEEQRQALDDYGKSNAGYVEGELEGVGDLSAKLLDDAAEYINIPTGLDTYGFGWSRTCPIIPYIEGGRFGKYKFRSDIFCNLANILGNLLVLVCLVLSAKYVFKGE